MTSFLSLDIDFWANHEQEKPRQPDIIFNKIFSLNRPVKVFEFHDEILPFLNKIKVDKLYQIDYHSDIADDYNIKRDELNEGTWANFYKFASDCDFEWRYPSYTNCFARGYGRCDLAESWLSAKFPYKSVSRKQGLSNIDWNSIQATAIVLSRNWWNNFDMERYVEKYSLEKHIYKK